jgi:peptidoglycan/LPS O-acetylase OafA/YrhL
MRLDKLDLVRGLAALAVFLGHLRGFLFVEHAKLPKTNVLVDLFYALTGFGHQAVMVFFVLSGFLIGGAVHERFKAQCWSFADYTLRRLTRLWVVLLPALAFTLLWDVLGSWLGGGVGYDGRFYMRNHLGPSLSNPAQHGGLIFLGNALFLQTIIVPSYGTNGPLWSLANEFWYYAMFPLGFAACSRIMGRWVRLLCGSLLLLIGFLLPFYLVVAGLIWLMGYGAFLLTRSSVLRAWRQSNAFYFVALLALFGILIWNRFRGLPYADFLIGLLFACMLPKLAADVETKHWWRKAARYLGEMSYSLYLFHFPCIAFFAFGLFKGKQWSPNLTGFAVYIGMALLVFGWSRFAWWFFEQRTEQVRHKIKSMRWFQKPAL